MTLLYRFASEDAPPLPLRLKIEINSREHFNVLELVHKRFGVRSRWFSGTARIPTYALDELLGTKLRALYQRKKGPGPLRSLVGFAAGRSRLRSRRSLFCRVPRSRGSQGLPSRAGSESGGKTSGPGIPRRPSASPGTRSHVGSRRRGRVGIRGDHASAQGKPLEGDQGTLTIRRIAPTASPARSGPGTTGSCCGCGGSSGRASRTSLSIAPAGADRPPLPTDQSRTRSPAATSRRPRSCTGRPRFTWGRRSGRQPAPGDRTPASSAPSASRRRSGAPWTTTAANCSRWRSGNAGSTAWPRPRRGPYRPATSVQSFSVATSVQFSVAIDSSPRNRPERHLPSRNPGALPRRRCLAHPPPGAPQRRPLAAPRGRDRGLATPCRSDLGPRLAAARWSRDSPSSDRHFRHPVRAGLSLPAGTPPGATPPRTWNEQWNGRGKSRPHEVGPGGGRSQHAPPLPAARSLSRIGG